MRAAYPHSEGKIDRNGVKLHYEIYGQGDHTIVFLPTWMFIHSRGYKSQIPYFAEHFRCITWDPRGNGKSDRPTDPQAFGQGHYVRDALAVLDATETSKAILMGYSQSGPTATLLAAHFPERVQALVTVGSHCPLVARHEHNSEAVYNGPAAANPVGWEKYNREYWARDFRDFAKFFSEQLFVEKHSTKQIEDVFAWSSGTSGEILAASMAAPYAGKYVLDEAAYRQIQCPILAVHGKLDPIAPLAASRKVAEITGCELVEFEDAGHAPHARYPCKFNTLMRDFLYRHLGTYKPIQRKSLKDTKRVLYLSSPIGLGHARRDLAVSRELRAVQPDLKIDWLAQDPVTRFLSANGEAIHPASEKLASESAHIEDECGEHDLNAFQAIRRMDEILVKNFMVFQEAVEQQPYDLIIADEAWDVDHYWHEHPELKKAQIAWMTDFVGWVPMPSNGQREAALTTDYNAEMITHVETHPGLRDRAIFVGNVSDIIPMGFGEDLPDMRDWVPKHYDFCGYILGQHPDEFGDREALRQRLGYHPEEQICIVTVGGSGVGRTLVCRILDAYTSAKAYLPALRMIVVAGPRLDLSATSLPEGVEWHPFVPDLDQHLAACDLALVQGGLSTCMELAAAGTPFLYFPLRNHFEQNFHVTHRLERYGAGRKMIFNQSPPEVIAKAMVEEITNTRAPLPVEADGAKRAAAMLSEML